MPFSTNSFKIGDQVVASTEYHHQQSNHFLTVDAQQVPSYLISSLNTRHFFLLDSCGVNSNIRPSLPTTNFSAMGTVHSSNRGRLSASLLDDNVLRTAEMFLFSSTVAAERGTVFLKNERSRTRIVRLTGGRNMTGFLEVDCFVAV